MRAKSVEHNPLPISNLRVSGCSILRTPKHVSTCTTKTYTPRHTATGEPQGVTLLRIMLTSYHGAKGSTHSIEIFFGEMKK